MGAYCGYLAAAAGLATGRGAGLPARGAPHDGASRGGRPRPSRRLLEGEEAARPRSSGTRTPTRSSRPSSSAVSSTRGKGLFDARQAILGHLQQGGNPSPFDRILATRLALRCADFLLDACGKGEAPASFMASREDDSGSSTSRGSRGWWTGNFDGRRTPGGARGNRSPPFSTGQAPRRRTDDYFDSKAVGGPVTAPFREAGVEDDRRELGVDEVLEFLPEVRERHAAVAANLASSWGLRSRRGVGGSCSGARMA